MTTDVPLWQAVHPSLVQEGQSYMAGDTILLKPLAEFLVIIGGDYKTAVVRRVPYGTNDKHIATFRKAHGMPPLS